MSVVALQVAKLLQRQSFYELCTENCFIFIICEHRKKNLFRTRRVIVQTSRAMSLQIGATSPTESFDAKKYPDGNFTFRRRPGCVYYAVSIRPRPVGDRVLLRCVYQSPARVEEKVLSTRPCTHRTLRSLPAPAPPALFPFHSCICHSVSENH